MIRHVSLNVSLWYQTLKWYIMWSMKRYVQQSTQMCVWQIVDAVPKQWFDNCPRDSTLPQFDNLCRCLVTSATATCSQLSTPTAKRSVVLSSWYSCGVVQCHLNRVLMRFRLTVAADGHKTMACKRIFWQNWLYAVCKVVFCQRHSFVAQ